MLSDLPKEHAVKESGFESSLVWIHQNPVFYYQCSNTLNWNSFQLPQRALPIMPSLSSCLLASGFRLPFLQSSALLARFCSIPLSYNNSPLSLAAHCSRPEPNNAGFYCSASLHIPNLCDGILNYVFSLCST